MTLRSQSLVSHYTEYNQSLWNLMALRTKGHLHTVAPPSLLPVLLCGVLII